MKSEEEIARMLLALVTLDTCTPGIDDEGKAQLVGMKHAMSWVLGAPLPPEYQKWFKTVVIFHEAVKPTLSLVAKKQKRQRRRRTRVHRGDAFCE